MKVEFLYFNLHGIGIIPRLVMAAGGIKFEDTRVTFPEGWPELKKTLPLGQVPVLRTNGLVINQSNAIINWAVRNGDLPKLCCEETSKSDMVAETCREIVDIVRNAATAAMHAGDMNKMDELNAKCREIATEKLIEQLPKIKTILNHVKAGEDSIVQGKLSLGDLYLLSLRLLCDDFGKQDAFPSSALSICENLRKTKRIADFLEQEKSTKFFPF